MTTLALLKLDVENFRPKLDEAALKAFPVFKRAFRKSFKEPKHPDDTYLERRLKNLYYQFVIEGKVSLHAYIQSVIASAETAHLFQDNRMARGELRSEWTPAISYSAVLDHFAKIYLSGETNRVFPDWDGSTALEDIAKWARKLRRCHAKNSQGTLTIHSQPGELLRLVCVVGAFCYFRFEVVITPCKGDKFSFSMVFKWANDFDEPCIYVRAEDLLMDLANIYSQGHSFEPVELIPQG